ncbi:MAG: hypothetical protein QXV10_00730, partial [Nitrososphaerota archaeon]
SKQKWKMTYGKVIKNKKRKVYYSYIPLNRVIKMILIDYREKDSGIPKLLMKKNIPISFENLEIGDYIIGDIVI